MKVVNSVDPNRQIPLLLLMKQALLNNDKYMETPFIKCLEYCGDVCMHYNDANH